MGVEPVLYEAAPLVAAGTINPLAVSHHDQDKVHMGTQYSWNFTTSWLLKEGLKQLKPHPFDLETVC